MDTSWIFKIINFRKCILAAKKIQSFYSHNEITSSLDYMELCQTQTRQNICERHVIWSEVQQLKDVHGKSRALLISYDYSSILLSHILNILNKSEYFCTVEYLNFCSTFSFFEFLELHASTWKEKTLTENSSIDDIKTKILHS